MKLTEKKKNIVEDHLKNKWKNRKCIFCNNDKWVITDSILELREFDEKRSLLGKGEQVMPVVSLMCSGCYHTIFLSAIKLGIIDSNGDEKKD